MRKNRGKIVSILLILLSFISIQINTYGHSGRTDSNGGHKDNKNKSGLGSYHYHCGGHPAHLHANGVCPYTSSSQSNKNSRSNSSSSSSKNSNPSSSSNKSGNSSSSSSIENKSNLIVKEPATIEVTQIKINENVKELEIGKSKTITATITPSNATDKNIIWKSSNENIAVINTTGEIIAKKAGIVYITATSSNGKTSAIEINIKDDAKRIENNTIIKTSTSVQNKTTGNIIENNQEDINLLRGFVILGLLGGGGYFGYKKYREK